MARHGHRPRDRRPRHQARALGRRQHPRRRAHGHGRRRATSSTTSSPATRPATRRSSRRSGPARSTSSPASTPTAPSGCSPTARRSVVQHVRPWPWRDGAHRAGAPRRGHRRRRPRPQHADRRPRRGVDAASRRPAVDDPRAADGTAAAARRATACSAKAPSHDYDDFTIPTPRPPESLDLNRNFPAGWGTGVHGQRRPPAQRARDRRARAGHRRPPQHLRLQRLPHQSAACCCGRRRSPPTRRCRRSTSGRGSSSASAAPRSPGTRCTRCSRTSRGTSRDTMSGAADDWAYEHLGVSRLDDRVLGRRPRRHRPQAVDPLLVPRPDRRRGAGRAAVVRRAPSRAATSTGTRSTTRSSDRSSSAAGTTCDVWHNPPPDLLRAEVAPHAEFAVYQALCSPRLEVRAHVGASGSATTRGASRSGSPTPAGCRPTSVTRRARTSLVKPIVVELTGDGLTVIDKPARREVGHLDGRAALRFTAASRRHARPGAGGWTVRRRRGRRSRISSPNMTDLVRFRVTCPLG